MSIHRLPRPRRRALAGAAAAVTTAAVLAGCGSATTATTATSSAATGPGGAAATTSTGARPGTPPGIGQQVTGAAAAKAKDAALARYPGTAERVDQLPDGSYLVHVLRTSGGELHVHVSTAFQVTGTEQGMPGGGPPSGARATRPGLGRPATGAAAARAKVAALAKYPGSAERVDRLSDGSYVVHVLRSAGEVHVKVSKAFAVTGVEQGMPGGAPGAGSTAPSTTGDGTASTQ